MSHTLLLADDSPTIAKILQMALANESYSIRAVLTAEEALQELKASPPKFFLVDLNLPSKNGYEFARLIRRDSKLRDVRVVLLASAFEPVDEVEYTDCGADGLVKKPFDPSELRAKLRSLVDLPPKFPDSARVTGSLSGFMVADPKDSTRTNLTIGGLTTNAMTDTSPDVLQGAQTVPSLLGGAPAGGSDADSILASLMGSAPEEPPAKPPSSEDFRPDKTILLDLGDPGSHATGDEVVHDITGSFKTPPGGTQAIELGTHTVNVTKAELPPPLPVEQPPPAPPKAPADEPLSANAQALAAFFEAELEPKKTPEPPAAAPLAEEPGAAPVDPFDASLDSIDWGTGPADSSLNQWSSSGAAKPAARKPEPVSDEPPPFSSPRVAPRGGTSPGFTPPSEAKLAGRGGTSPGFTPKRELREPAPEKTPPLQEASAEAPRPFPSRGAEPSMLFDTGGSSFRFSEDYIARITKSFTGTPDEHVPEHQTHVMFPQSSDDRGPSAPAAEPAPAAATAPSRVAGGGAWSEGDVQKIEQIVREEVQMVVREVAEKIAWEVIPELAENLIRKELEKVLKEMGQ
jgi:DNA-binding response OmpR family regulator